MNSLVREFYEKYERHISSLALVGGFIFDYFTLNRVDFLFDNFLIIFYLVFAGASIIVINLFETDRSKNKFIENIYEFLPLFLQFLFGGLFSAFVVFYSKSASLFTSGPFVLVLITLLVGNEFLKKKYSRLIFQVGIYFLALFSFTIYFLPVLTTQMGALIFLLSGAISLVIISFFIYVIASLAPDKYKESGKYLLSTVSVLYISINILYFTNIIPPIPLSLKLGEAFHYVERQTSGDYLAIGEKNMWYEKFSLSQTIHLKPQDSVYVFSSVFAPTDLDIKIIHDWQYFDKSKGKWVSLSTISFSILGGRNEGYRGFSKKDTVSSGKWRVDIKTERGQVIGRVRFEIEMGLEGPGLETKTI